MFTRMTKSSTVITSISGTPDSINSYVSRKIDRCYSRMVFEIIKSLEEIQSYYKVSHLIIEDYVLLEHKTSGAFSIPAFIGALKHHWFMNTMTEAIVVPATTWKVPICGNAYAEKDSICNSVKREIGNEQYDEVLGMYSSKKLENERNPQDCIDAIGIDLFVFKTIRKAVKYGGSLSEDIAEDINKEPYDRTESVKEDNGMRQQS